MKKEKLFLSILDSENNEVYTSKDMLFSDLVNNIPYQFSFTIYYNNSNEKLKFDILLKDADGIEDILVGQIGDTFCFETNQDNQTLSDKYNLNLTKKNYFSVSKNKSSGNTISFFLKLNIENGKDSYIREEQNEQNWDNI